MEEEKLIKYDAKRKKEKTKKWGAEIKHLKLSQKMSQLSQTELTHSTKKKKKFFFKILKYLSNSKFSIQNFHSQIFNSTDLVEESMQMIGGLQLLARNQSSWYMINKASWVCNDAFQVAFDWIFPDK